VLEQSIAEARAVGDPHLLSMALRHFGQALLFFGRYAEARDLFEEALALSRAAGPARESAWNLSALGTTLIVEGRPDASEALLRESIAVGRESGDDTPVISSLRALGEFYRIRGDFTLGRQTVGEAVAMARHSKLWSVSLLVTLGDLAAAEQDWHAATDFYRQALDLVGRIGLHGTMAYTLRRYAASCVARSDYFGAALIYGSTSSTAAAAWALMFAPPSREEDVVNCARQALGEEQFAAAWAEGAALGLEQIIAQILREGHGT
jgi:tetratricopeptide (TPR) repeat protein